MKHFSLFTLISLAVIMSGCAKFDYVGRTFNKLDETAVVAWHTADNPVPAGKYRVIGRGTLTFREGKMDKYDIEERLIEEARKIGADAVLQQKNVTTEITTFEIDSSVDTAKAQGRGVQSGTASDGSTLAINDFGKETPLKGNVSSSSDITVHAVFYKKSDAVKKMIESQNVRIMSAKEAK